MADQPKITLGQLNRRGACLDQLIEFKSRYGNEAVVTVERCVEVADVFAFDWAINFLLHNPHMFEAWEAADRRLEEEDDYDRVCAEEFARAYIKAYPNVP